MCSTSEKYGLFLKSVLKKEMQRELVEFLVKEEGLSVGDSEWEDERNATPEAAHGLSVKFCPLRNINIKWSVI